MRQDSIDKLFSIAKVGIALLIVFFIFPGVILPWQLSEPLFHFIQAKTGSTAAAVVLTACTDLALVVSSLVLLICACACSISSSIFGQERVQSALCSKTCCTGSYLVLSSVLCSRFIYCDRSPDPEIAEVPESSPQEVKNPHPVPRPEAPDSGKTVMLEFSV